MPVLPRPALQCIAMTPATKLQSDVSLLRTPNFYSMKRFVIPPALANVMVPLPLKSTDMVDYGNITVGTPMSVDGIDDDSSETEDETFMDASESSSNGVVMAHVAPNVDMPVPLQPRKAGVNGGQADAAGDGPGSAASMRVSMP